MRSHWKGVVLGKPTFDGGFITGFNPTYLLRRNSMQTALAATSYTGPLIFLYGTAATINAWN